MGGPPFLGCCCRRLLLAEEEDKSEPISLRETKKRKDRGRERVVLILAFVLISSCFSAAVAILQVFSPSVAANEICGVPGTTPLKVAFAVFVVPILS